MTIITLLQNSITNEIFNKLLTYIISFSENVIITIFQNRTSHESKESDTNSNRALLRNVLFMSKGK